MADLSGSKYLGNWRLTSVSMKDKYEEPEEDYILTLNADGSASFTAQSAQVEDYTWKEADYGVYLEGKSDLKLKDEGDYLMTKVLGVTLKLEKQ